MGLKPSCSSTFSFCLNLRITYKASSHCVGNELNKVAAKVRLSVPKRRKGERILGGVGGGGVLLFLLIL